MHVKEVIIDGFKSYAKRTVISGWDSEFNAITGLNGSGKSNILDAICFVLGISNLSHVRVGSLRELVYKQGQAHVTKASVTIVFDNRKKDQSPVGYEVMDEITITREVVVGGKNRYFINKQVAQLNRVQNLFHSVQLNVNNPHFLIMQGRITKVLNMKPPEILAMVKEAAGTQLFDTKRNSALKTIAKKQRKVEEINAVLAEEITPQIEKLRSEAEQCHQWDTLSSEVSKMERFCTAYSYYKACSFLENSAANSKQMANKTAENESVIRHFEEEIRHLNKQIANMKSERSKGPHGSFGELGQRVEDMSKALIKQEAEFSNQRQVLQSEKAALQEQSDANEAARVELEAKQASYAQEKKKMDTIELESKAVSDRIARIEGSQLGFKVGSNDDGDAAGSLVEQKMKAQQKLNKLQGEQESCYLHASRHLQPELKQKKALLKNLAKSNATAGSSFASVQTKEKRLKEQLDACMFDADTYHKNEAEIERGQATLEELSEKFDVMSSKLTNVNFEFQLPAKHGGTIYGKIARLIRCRDKNNTMALEVCAGAKLYQVVVDSDATASTILKAGKKLKERVTMIPLNKVKSYPITAAKFERAAQLVGPQSVTTADKLIDYPSEIQNAIAYAFGNTFICDTAQHAEQVAFHKDIRTKAVTLDGDVFNPSGTLTGGSRPKKASVLSKVMELAQVEQEMELLRRTLEQLAKEQNNLEQYKKRHEKLTKQMEVVQHEIQLSSASLGASEYGQCVSDVEALEEKIRQREMQHNDLGRQIEQVKQLISQIEKETTAYNESGANTNGTKKQLAALKKENTAVSKKLEKQEAVVSRLALHIESLESEIKEGLADLDRQKQIVFDTEAALLGLERTLNKNKAAFWASEQELEQMRDTLSSMDSEIQSLNTKIAELSKQKRDKELENKKLNHKLTQMNKELEDAKRKVTSLVKSNPWIDTEKQQFGQKHSDYDFARFNPNEVYAALQEKQQAVAKMGKRLNRKAIQMKGKAEEEYDNLMQKRIIIENDKRRIEQVIDELDQEKNETLKRTFKKVTKDFGSIFSTLLPGATAKLEPPEGETIYDGLAVRVAFDNVWKDSLSELSGGQRSLLALSLILSLLLFKPAPMYILDEIDAALDLSHTQNIGKMLKSHFSQSQFIVVSLKEGMFANANVLFRTKFVDGVSTVSRTTTSRK